MQNTKILFAKINHLKLLYIEDNEDVRQSTLGLFNNIFNHITVAQDGEDALKKLETASYGYDLVITDINMPKIDGYEVISRIREKNKDVKIYILSAYNQIDNVHKAGSCVNAYLYKPLNIKKLFEVLQVHYGDKV